MAYEDYIESKSRMVAQCTGIDDPALSDDLFDFQRSITQWALARGRAGIWADCGLGKSFMALEWSRVVAAHTDSPVLILTPLAVASQFVREGDRWGVTVNHVRTGADVKDGVNVCNYERLHLIDTDQFSGVVADESSILKDYSSATRNEMVARFASTPWRLSCTATPSPNDVTELGNQAEFLGVMSRTEMLSMFFVHDGGSTQDWRIKGHAVESFWRWVASWAIAIRRPSDIGYSDDGYALPPLHMHHHVTPSSYATEGELFASEARTLSETRTARRVSITDRAALLADIVRSKPDRPWVVWCDLNAEADAATAAIPGAVQIAGSDSADVKESRMDAFAHGHVRVIVTKPSIAGWGVNWQHCADVAFLGVSHSFEAWYQAIRRSYRFGQTSDVNCHIITSDAESAVLRNLRRKQADADAMAVEMVSAMADEMKSSISGSVRTFVAYNPTYPILLPMWIYDQRD